VAGVWKGEAPLAADFACDTKTNFATVLGASQTVGNVAISLPLRQVGRSHNEECPMRELTDKEIAAVAGGEKITIPDKEPVVIKFAQNIDWTINPSGFTYLDTHQIQGGL